MTKESKRNQELLHMEISNSVSLCWVTAGGVTSVGERVTFSSPDENARAGETAPKLQCQPTLATPLVVCCVLEL